MEGGRLGGENVFALKSFITFLNLLWQIKPWDTRPERSLLPPYIEGFYNPSTVLLYGTWSHTHPRPISLALQPSGEG
jgi:hypothetical protein